MKGIDPYIKTIGACHSTYRVVAWGFGRLGSRYYGCGIFTALPNGIAPYIETVGASYSTGRHCPVAK